MLHSLLYSPFADAARQVQYEAVRAALLAEPNPATALLLGNFEVEGEVIDALVVRPRSITVLLFVPEGGLLEISTQPEAAWQLGPYTLHGDEHAANPFEQFLHQQEAVAAWLTTQLPSTQILPEYITGIVLFADTVQFAPSVEAYLRRQPGAENFQLLGSVDQLPRRLRQLGHSELTFSDNELLAWAHDLTASAAAGPGPEPEEAAGPGFWEQKARQLWYWLGAVDIPEDAPYGAPAEAVAAGQQEMQRLEQLSQQVHTELTAQRQAMEVREAEREQSIAQLRAQLEQAPSAAAEAAELRTRLQQESQEKAALEEAIRASRQEADARNRELDARIQQLGQLIEQMQQRPPTPVASAAPAAPSRPVPAPAAAAKPAAAPRPAAASRSMPTTAAQPAGASALHGLRRLHVSTLRLPRVGLVVAVLICAGLAGWAIVQSSGRLLRKQEPARTATRPEYQPEAETDESEATPPTIEDILPDTIEVTTETRPDRVTGATRTPEEAAPPPDSAETTTPETSTEEEQTDSLGQPAPVTP